jgi:hypothetical protein
MNSMKAIKPYAQNRLDQFTILPDRFDVGDSSLLRLISQYNMNQLDKQILLRTHDFHHPLIEESNRKLAVLQNSLVQKIDLKMSRLADEIKADQLSKDKEGAKAVPAFPAEQVLTSINKQRQVKVTLYLHLLQKREKILESVISAEPRLTVINKPEDHVSPIKARSGSIYFLALIFGICLPMLILNKREANKW